MCPQLYNIYWQGLNLRVSVTGRGYFTICSRSVTLTEPTTIELWLFYVCSYIISSYLWLCLPETQVEGDRKAGIFFWFSPQSCHPIVSVGWRSYSYNIPLYCRSRPCLIRVISYTLVSFSVISCHTLSLYDNQCTLTISSFITYYSLKSYGDTENKTI